MRRLRSRIRGGGKRTPAQRGSGRALPAPSLKAAPAQFRKIPPRQRLRGRGRGSCGGRGDGTSRASERLSVSRGPKPEGGAVPTLWLPGAAARDCSLLPPTGREAGWRRLTPARLHRGPRRLESRSPRAFPETAPQVAAGLRPRLPAPESLGERDPRPCPRAVCGRCCSAWGAGLSRARPLPRARRPGTPAAPRCGAAGWRPVYLDSRPASQRTRRSPFCRAPLRPRRSSRNNFGVGDVTDDSRNLHALPRYWVERRASQTNPISSGMDTSNPENQF